MKRKNGSKKEKIKKVENDEEVNTQESESESSGSDEEENDEKVEIEPESEPVKEEKTTLPAPLIVRPTPTVVYGRVKVKFRNSNLNSNSNSNSNLNSKPTPVEVVQVGSNSNDGDKSNRHVTVGSSQGGVVVDEKVEESVSGLCESKKCGGIKIVSSKGLSPTGTKESGAASGSSSLDEKKENQEMKSKSNNRGEMLRFNKQELEASLEVIKKVMKMDAAEPFNVPVNPVELGIPDYFDVIDTPMDFGTICNNLESGGKYMNSEDVYKDVQYIWDNCFKYNNKGDYIVDLMKRVKKNFMKYWMAAGLYTEQTKKTNGGESIPMDEATSSGHGKKLKKGKGVKRHKDGCMCAICIMKRRRREREAREARESGAQVASPQLEITMMDLPQECKQEANSHAESPHGEDTSSYMETSPDVDADAEMEDADEVRLERATPRFDDEQKAEDDRVEFRDGSDRSGDISEKSQRSDKGETETYSHVETKVQDGSGSRIKVDTQKQLSAQPEGQTPGYMQQRHELMELEKKRQRLRLIETFRDLENPMLLDLCGTLFPNKRHSVWNGANSLARHHSSNHRSDIHEAIASFMAPYKSSSSHSRK